MINANELRLGNYILYLGELYVVNGLKYENNNPHKYRIMFTTLNGKISNGKTQNWIDPIPLNSEILQKCGFCWVDGFLSIDLKHARMRLAFCNGVRDKMTLFQFQGLTYDSAKEFPMHFGSNHPCFLHDLQNLYFALTGEELKVNL